MTGYGKAVSEVADKRIQIEIKTLNSKNIDINLRLPSSLRGLELAWRKQITETLKRGKVDVYVNIEKSENQSEAKLNKALISHYLEELKDITALSEKDNAKLLEIALTLPDALISKEEELSEAEIKAYNNTLNAALKDVNIFRSTEGKNLELDISENITAIQNQLEMVINLDGSRKDRTKQRLETALLSNEIEYDKNRFEQELIYYLEKFDISEEKTRLKSHIDHFRQIVQTLVPNGKKLNFVAQEIGREINTIGSKANDAQIQSIVVEMKDQLEKIKEQLLNIL
jgi:uncharacterized protein (TIGR00255 family)